MNGDNSKPLPKAEPVPAPDAVDIVPAPPGGDRVGHNHSGRVRFDDRGNAVWEWSIATGAFGREATTQRLKKLEHPALSLADEAPTPFDAARANPAGTRKGYNPYDSGKLGKTGATSRKKDLRKLSEWLKLKKQATETKQDEDDDK